MATPADEITTAAKNMSRWPGPAAEPTAKLLREIAALHEPKLPGHSGQIPPGCQWCADEDWPCADTRHALAVARAINTGETR